MRNGPFELAKRPVLQRQMICIVLLSRFFGFSFMFRLLSYSVKDGVVLSACVGRNRVPYIIYSVTALRPIPIHIIYIGLWSIWPLFSPLVRWSPAPSDNPFATAFAVKKHLNSYILLIERVAEYFCFLYIR